MFQLFIVHSDENSAWIMSARTRGSNSIADPLIWTRADIAEEQRQVLRFKTGFNFDGILIGL